MTYTEARAKACRMTKTALARDLERRGVYGAVPLIRWSRDELIGCWLEHVAGVR